MRVLLVEDDATTAASIKMMLTKENFICDTIDLGEDGLEIGKLYDYDIIVLDLMLPDIDGYEVLRRLRSARVRTPILILSGLAELDHKIKGLGFGADDFLTKPFDGATADDVRAGRQSQNCKGARVDHSALDPRPRR